MDPGFKIGHVHPGFIGGHVGPGFIDSLGDMCDCDERVLVMSTTPSMTHHTQKTAQVLQEQWIPAQAMQVQ